MKNGPRSRRLGFSMVELLIVIIVIGILAAIAVPLFVGQRTKAKDAAVKVGVRAVQVGIVSWAAEHDDVYPRDSDVTSLRWNGRPSAFSAYVQPWPSDPYTGAPMRNSWDKGYYTYHRPVRAGDRAWYFGMPGYALFGHLSTGKTFPSE